MRSLVSLGFLALHLGGGAIALVMLDRAWEHRLLVRILIERVPLLGPNLTATGAGLWLFPLGLALVVGLAVLAAGRTASRLRRGEPESDILLHGRALLYAGMGCVLFNAFVLSTPESFSGPFRLRHPILGEVSLAFAYGAYALWSLLLPRLRRIVSPRLGRGLDLLCMNLVLLVGLAEVGLRAVRVIRPSHLLVTDSTPAEIRREAGRQEPGSMRFGFPMNEGGHYDTEFVGRTERTRPLVVSIGDSFSYGMVPLPFHFTSVAERETGVEIYNVGFPGTGPGDYLYLLEQLALPLEPDLVVVQLFLGNDVTAPHQETSPARWHDADRYLVAVVWFRLQLLRKAEVTALANTADRFDPTPEELNRRYPWLSTPSLEKPSLSRAVYREMEKQQAWVLGMPHAGVYERFFEALGKLERAAGRVPLAFVLIPDEFQVEDPLWKEIVSESDDDLDLDLSQRKVVAWLDARGRAVLDLLPVLRAVEPFEDGWRHLYHLQDTHFNARGNEIAGRALAGFVERLLSEGSAVAEPGRSSGGSAPVTPDPSSEGNAVVKLDPPMLSLPLDLDLGDAEARQLMTSGWARHEGGVSWSEGPGSVLHIPLPEGRDLRMIIEVLPLAFPGAPDQHVGVVVNGTAVGRVLVRPGLHEYSVVLPADLLVGSTTTLEFDYAYTRVPAEVLPESPDTRRLAVAWRSIAFEEMETAATGAERE